jgi:hypothetical protein
MAHFAELDENNVVLRVIVISNNVCLDQYGNESEAIGAKFCHDTLGGVWKQTSYSGSIRARYAGDGYIYRQDLDSFIAPQPFPSWSLNEETTEWEALVPKPEGAYIWIEESLSWQLIV